MAKTRTQVRKDNKARKEFEKINKDSSVDLKLFSADGTTVAENERVLRSGMNNITPTIQHGTSRLDKNSARILESLQYEGYKNRYTPDLRSSIASYESYDVTAKRASMVLNQSAMSVKLPDISIERIKENTTSELNYGKSSFSKPLQATIGNLSTTNDNVTITNIAGDTTKVKNGTRVGDLIRSKVVTKAEKALSKERGKFVAGLQKSITGGKVNTSLMHMHYILSNVNQQFSELGSWREGLGIKYPGLGKHEVLSADPNKTYTSIDEVKNEFRSMLRDVKPNKRDPTVMKAYREHFKENVLGISKNYEADNGSMKGWSVANSVSQEGISRRGNSTASEEILEALSEDKYHTNEPFKSYTGDVTAKSRSLQTGAIDSATMRSDRLTDVQESKQGSNYIRPYSNKIGSGTKLRVDRADELYAAYNGMNTTVEDAANIKKYVSENSGRIVNKNNNYWKDGRREKFGEASGARVANGREPRDVALRPKQVKQAPATFTYMPPSTASENLAPNPNRGQLVKSISASEVGDYSEAFKETDDSISKINPLLRGISTLNDGDASTMKQMHNQDLVNKRAGNRAGYVGLKDSDIYLEGNKKSLAPWQMTNKRSLTHGYGMGWGNAWRADRSTHAMRAISTVNPFSRGNASIGMEALGRISTRDRLLLNANPTVMNRLTTMAIPLTAAATLGFGMYDNQSVGELATNMLLPAVALPGARAGLSVGAMLTPAKTSSNLGILRGLGMGIGATTGVALAATAVIGASALATDITSNESSIRKMAKKFTTKEIYTQSEDSRQSLTARQMALNKLSKSGLNDRALLLGNEAAGLAGLI